MTLLSGAIPQLDCNISLGSLPTSASGDGQLETRHCMCLWRHEAIQVQNLSREILSQSRTAFWWKTFWRWHGLLQVLVLSHLNHFVFYIKRKIYICHFRAQHISGNSVLLIEICHFPAFTVDFHSKLFLKCFLLHKKIIDTMSKFELKKAKYSTFNQREHLLIQ